MEIEDERSKPSDNENHGDHIEKAFSTCTSDKQIVLEEEEPFTMTSPVKQKCIEEADSREQSKNCSNEKANTFGLMGNSAIVNHNFRDLNIPKNDITASFIPSSNEGYRLFHPKYSIDFESESELSVNNIVDPINRSFSGLSATINVTKVKE